jgi:erythromycin esterase
VLRPVLFRIVVGLVLIPAGLMAADAAWIAWVRDHHHAVRLQGSAEDDYADLQFLKTVLEGRRIVQLGESHHSVAEYGTTKTRLIKFLHEQMGFDVLLFESGLYECFAVDFSQQTAANALNASIFGVWATEEVLPLFDYIKASQSTERPLTFRGFDPQISSRSGVTSRPAFFRRMIAPIDPAYADEVFAFDTTVIQRINSAYATSEESRLVPFYERLTAFFETHRERLRELEGNEAALVAERSAWSMVRHVQQLRSFQANQNDSTMGGHMAIRDGAMADNITAFAQDLYPDKKIIIWAANIHVRHASERTTWVFPTMGGWLAERFRDELYTIGIYPNRGQVSTGSRTVAAIAPAPDGTMEQLLTEPRVPLVFVDFLHAPREAGTEWIYQTIPSRDSELFTTGMRTVPIVPREQYDGVLLFDEVSPPRFLTR